MRINSIALARSTWIVDLNEINPDGTAFGPIHRALVEQYRFLNFPSPGPSTFEGSQPAIYKGGEFNFKGKPVGVNLAVYNDGFAAESGTSTDTSDEFLNDVSKWLVSNFGLKNPRDFMKRPPLYLSQLFFNSDVSLATVCKPIQEFTQLLRQYTGNQTEEPWAFLFEPDQQPASFTFERRANVPFSEKQYYSNATLPTPKHIELLEHFEKMFS